MRFPASRFDTTDFSSVFSCCVVGSREPSPFSEIRGTTHPGPVFWFGIRLRWMTFLPFSRSSRSLATALPAETSHTPQRRGNNRKFSVKLTEAVRFLTSLRGGADAKAKTSAFAVRNNTLNSISQSCARLNGGNHYEKVILATRLISSRTMKKASEQKCFMADPVPLQITTNWSSALRLTGRNPLLP